MAALDTSGLRPLDTSGLESLDTSGLQPLDTSGLRPLEIDENDQPGRLRTASSQFARGLGSIASGLPKSVGLIGTPDPDIFRNFDRIDQGKFVIPKPIQSNVIGVELADPMESLYEDYIAATPEQRQAIRNTFEDRVRAAQEGPAYRTGQSIDKFIAGNFPVNPELQDEFWSSKVPQALGSATGFALSAVATRGALGGGTAASFVAPAALGSAVNRVDQFESALAEGAEIGDALRAAQLGGIIGTTEAIPIGNLLNRLDRISGGQVKRYVARAVQQGTEEAVQEAFSGILNAAVAQQLYDPERGIWTAERGEEAAVGFTTGAILETLVTLALPGRRRGSVNLESPESVQANAEARLAELEASDTLSELEADERDFLRENRTRPSVIAEAYGIQMEPLGERDKAREAAPQLTEDDIASPIPDDLILEGKAVVEDALAADRASEALREAGFPEVDTDVVVDGERARVVDAIDGGAKIEYEDGQVVPESFESLSGRVRPAEVQDAEEVRSDTRQGDQRRDEREGREIEGGADLQRPEEAGASASDRPRQAAPAQKAETSAPRRTAEQAPEALDTSGLTPIQSDVSRESPNVDSTMAIQDSDLIIEQRVDDTRDARIRDGRDDRAPAAEETRLGDQAGIPPSEVVAPVQPESNSTEGAGTAVRTDLPAERQAADGEPPLTGEPEVPEGMTRLYHGSAEHGRYTGPAWFSTNRKYAENYRENAELQFVDMPTEWVNEKLDPDGLGQSVEAGFTLNIEIGSDETGARRPVVAEALQAQDRLRGNRIDDEWVQFAPESQTRAIPRNDMPQIKAEHRGALANFLKARGIEGAEEAVAASTLKPTQAEFSEKKVQKAKDFEGGDRAILVSSDGHVLDGHHQWIAAADQGQDIRIIRLDAPITDLLQVVPEFPSAEGGQPDASETTDRFSIETVDNTELRIEMRATEAWQQSRDAVANDLRRELDNIGLGNVGLRVVDSMRVIDRGGQVVGSINGRYSPGVIDLSLSSLSDFSQTLRHEAIHALRDLGVFRTAEWRALSSAALADTDAINEVRERYSKANLNEEQLIEERVADMYGQWLKDQGQQTGFVRSAFRRMQDFLEALSNVLRGNGFTSANQIFQQVESGDVAQRFADADPTLVNEQTASESRFSIGAGQFDVSRAAAAERRVQAQDPPPSDRQSNRFLDEAIFRFQDKFNYLHKEQKRVAAERGLDRVPEAEDVYLAELRYHGMAGAAIEDFQRDHVEPLAEAMSEARVTVEDVDRYLHARHAPEANAQLKRINPDRENNDALSGLSNEDAAAVMEEFRSSGKIDELQSIAERVDAITKAQRDLLVESGLETEETIKKWEETYEHYAPLHRDGFQETATRGQTGRGFSVTGRQARRAGSNRAVTNILAHVIAQHESTIVRAEKNKVAQSMYEFAKNNQNTDLYEVDKADYKPTFGADGLVTYRPQRGFQFADNVLAVKVEGIDHTITFNERSHTAMRIVHALKNVGSDKSGPVLNPLMRMTRYLALVNTGANPEFIISNFVRDLQTAGYNISSTDADNMKWRVIKDVGKAWRGIRRFQKGKGGDWAQYFDEFRKAGAQTGWVDIYNDIAQREERLKKMVQELGQDAPLLKVKRAIRSVVEFVEQENTAVENAIRLSAFVHSRRAGISEAESARLAKELTVNFNRKGDYGQVMNALYLFYNASIQGSARIIEASVKSPKVRKLIGATVVFAAFLDMLNRALAGDDEDGQNRYDKISPHVKERNMIIMLPEGRGDYIKIPLPWGYNVFHVMGQSIGEGLTKERFDAVAAGARVASAVTGAFNPIGGDVSLPQLVSPTIADPIVQWAENKDWAGRPIYPEDNPFDVGKPDSQKYWNSVREPSRWVTEQINALTGGSEMRPGAIDISPEAIDLMIDFFTGGAGRFISDSVSTPIKAIQDKEIESYEVPLLRKLYGRPGLGSLFEEYHENSDAIRITEKEAKHFMETNQPQRLAELRAERPGEYALIDARRRTDRQLSKIRQERKRIEASNLPDAEKKRRLKALSRQMELTMLRFNRMYYERVEG